MIIQRPLYLGDVNGNAVDLALNPAAYFRDPEAALLNCMSENKSSSVRSCCPVR
jgi:hypothetical protein